MPRKISFFFFVLFFVFSSHPLLAQDYSGTLFDTHMHNDDLDSDTFSNISSSIGDDQVTAIIMFFAVYGDDGAVEDLEDGIESIEAMVNDHPNRIVPFFHSDYQSVDDFDLTEIQTILDSDAGTLVSGLGEVGLYRSPWTDENVGPDNAVFTAAYPTLTENSLWIMMHPTTDMEEVIDQTLTAYPDQNFLFHGGASLAFIDQILTDHSNAYFTIDTASLTMRGSTDEGNNLLFASDINSADDFLTAYNNEYDALLAQALTNWQTIIENHPDQVFWGTDAAYDFHFDAEVYEALITFSRDFIGMLDPSVQEKYALTNAQAQFTPLASSGSGSSDDDSDDSSSSGSCVLGNSSPSVYSLLLFIPLLLIFSFTVLGKCSTKTISRGTL